MVFQSYALYPQMTVRGNMSFGLKIAGLPKAEIAKRVERASEILQIGPLLDRKPGARSGGPPPRAPGPRMGWLWFSGTAFRRDHARRSRVGAHLFLVLGARRAALALLLLLVLLAAAAARGRRLGGGLGPIQLCQQGIQVL